MIPSKNEGKTGVILYDLPSPYVPHRCGLLHLPRFIAKIKKHLAGELPQSYQRNFTKGFDGFLCLHLGIQPAQVIEAVKQSGSDEQLDAALKKIFPADLRVHVWNREMVQKGMSEVGRESLEKAKADLGLAERQDIRSFADMIDYDEGRID